MGRWFAGLLLVISGGLLAGQRADDPLKEGDRAFKEQVFSEALDHYEKALGLAEHAPSRDHIRRRIGMCQARLSKFDVALTTLKDAVSLASRPAEAAHTLLERGVIALTMPNYYYEKDGVRSWGQWVQGGTYHFVGHDLLNGAIVDLANAGAGFDTALASGKGEQDYEGQLRSYLELASAVERVVSERPDFGPEGLPDGAFGGVQGWPERLAWCFDQAIAAHSVEGRERSKVFASYMKAMAFRRYIESLSGVVSADGKLRCQPRGESNPTFVVPDGWNPIKILEGVRAQARNTALGDSVLLALATIQRDLGLYVDAVANARKLIDQHPKSRMVGVAQGLIHEITSPVLTTECGVSVPTRIAPEIQVSSRNLGDIRVRVYRFSLSELVGGDRGLEDDEFDFSSAEQIIKALGRMPGSESEVVSVLHGTGDAGDHAFHSQVVALPVLDPGAYIVEATGGDLTYRDVLLVSDLGMVRRADGDRTSVFVMDAKTGEPRADASVVFRYSYRAKTWLGNRERVQLRRVSTDENGLAEAVFPDAMVGGGRVSVAATSLGQGALVGSTWFNPRRAASTQDVGYLFTDRPVYRPGHDVQFAVILRRRLDGAYENPGSTTVDLKIQDPRGATVFDQSVRTDDSGALKERLTLGAEPALGAYRIVVSRGDRNLRVGGFQVEEYKKPEFEVTVKAPNTQMVLGGGCSAVIEGSYYFGGAVAGGEVTYRVFRERFYPSFRTREPYRAFYGDILPNVDPSDRGRGRELVIEGSGTLDDQGRLVIEWSTADHAAAMPDQDMVYTVQADITDASRRTISGSARIPVTRSAFQVAVSTERGFWGQGETAAFEIQAQTPSGQPVASTGKVRVFRVTQEMRGQEPYDVLTQVLEEPASTDSFGRGAFRWVADEAGRFAVMYITSDQLGTAVQGESRVWVHGVGFTANGFQMKNLEILTDRPVYEPGDQALVLLNSNEPDSSVLVCLVAGDRTLMQRVLRLHGKTAVLTLPVDESWTPNTHLVAYTVRRSGFFFAHQEVLVPPRSRFLDVQVAFDREEYKPGEMAEAVIKVADHRGEPVAARIGLSTLDASLLYIQQDQTVDIRKFFYGSRRGRTGRQDASVTFGFQGYLSRDIERPEFPYGHGPCWWNEPGQVTRILAGESFESEIVAERILRDWGGLVAEASDSEGAELKQADGVGRARRAGSREPAPSSAAPFAPPGEDRNFEDEELARSGDDGDGSADQVRSDFRDTAAWVPDAFSGPDGLARVPIPFPDSLTTWRTRAVAWTPDTRVGVGTADVRTSKDVLVRLQAPRFFTEGDRLILSALVNNRTDQPLDATVSLDLGDSPLRVSGERGSLVPVPAGGEARVDWWCDVIGSGEASITVSAVTPRDRDAMRMTFPVQTWGTQKTVTQVAILNGGETRLGFQVPGQRRIGSSRLEVTVQPSLALTLLDALPYLIEYPYGCTEQTISRFIPAVVCAQVLKEAGTSLDALAESRRNLPRAAEQGSNGGPVTDRMLAKVVQVGLQRLEGMQNSDGGFGWWSRDRSSPYLSAYVLQGLMVAKEAGLALNDAMVDRVAGYLESQTKSLDQVQIGAFVGYALAKAGRSPAELLTRVFRARGELGIYGKALLASSLALSGRRDDAEIVVRGFADHMREDPSRGTVHWQPEGPGWSWWNSPIEANAAVLQALLDVNPGSKWIDPLCQWLVRNRQGNRWSNTRDTAQAILALVRQARRAGELDPDYTLQVTSGGNTKEFRVTKANLFSFDNVFAMTGDAIEEGDLPVVISMKGSGRAYVTARLSLFTQEEKITGAGHELFVRRSYHRVQEVVQDEVVDGRTVQKISDVLTPLSDDAEIQSGDLIEVELEIDAGNNYEYVLVEDFKPAGFEPLALRSGGNYQNGVASHVEYRDERTAFFVTWFQQGKQRLRYRLRAEVPGQLRALPARAEAMYAPWFGGISDSFRTIVKDRRTQ